MITNLKDIDALDKLLFIGIIFFCFVLIGLATWAPNDGQTFQVISGLLTGFGGAFFARLKPKPEGGIAAGDVGTAGTNGTTAGTTASSPAVPGPAGTAK